MTRRRSHTSTRSACSVSVRLHALRGAYCVKPPRVGPVAHSVGAKRLKAATRSMCRTQAVATPSSANPLLQPALLVEDAPWMRFFENKPHSGLGVDHELILF